MANKYEGISFWSYTPNKAAAIAFLAVFLITTLIHLWQCHHYKSYRLTVLFVVAGFLYVIGFAFRVNGAFGNFDQLIPFIISVCFIYVSPPLLLLANCDILGRVLYYVPYLAPIKPGRVISTFGILSLIVEGINGIAASFSANPEANHTIGEVLMYTSLALQLLMVGLFVGLAGTFHRRCAKAGLAGSRGVKMPLVTLYASTALILIRTIYRAIEHSVDVVAITEWPFYVFEASIMLIDMFWWNVQHPLRFLPQSNATYLSRDGVTEIKSSGGHDAESSVPRWLDPLHLSSLFQKRGKPRSRSHREDGEPADEVYIQLTGSGSRDSRVQAITPSQP